MPESALLFALLSGVSIATWNIFLKLGSVHINPALGAMVITGMAFFVNLTALLVMRASGHQIVATSQGFGFLVVAGIAASGVDIFGLLAYARGPSGVVGTCDHSGPDEPRGVSEQKNVPKGQRLHMMAPRQMARADRRHEEMARKEFEFPRVDR